MPVHIRIDTGSGEQNGIESEPGRRVQVSRQVIYKDCFARADIHSFEQTLKNGPVRFPHPDITTDNETIEVPSVGGRKPRIITKRALAEIIEPRMSEMLELVYREIQTSGYGDMAPAGVVMTGGASLLKAVPDLAEQLFDMPVRVGYPRRVRGLADKVKDPIYATGVGLILHGANERKSGDGGRRFIKANHFNRILKRMKDWLSTYF